MKKTLYYFLFALLCIFYKPSFSQKIKHGTGDNTTPAEYKSILKVAERSTRDLMDLPSSYSLKAFAPPIKDQGQYGTCVAWSSAYAARTISYAVQRNFTTQDSIIKYSFSPGHLYYRIKQKTDLNCANGASIYTALSVLKAGGNILKSENVPDCTPTLLINDEQVKSIPYKIKDFVALSDYGVISKNEILKAKKSLTEKKPVLFSLRCYSSFYNVPSDGLWTPTSPDQLNGNHAMCIIGYDDNKAGGAFEVMNSWGTSWGNKGFFWLTYDQLMKCGNALLEMMDMEAEKKKQVIAVADKPKLSGKIEFIKLDGSMMPVSRSKISTRAIDVVDDEQAAYSKYKFTENYQGGTAFKIKFTTNAPAYVYIFSEDDKQEISKLFPYASNVSAAINSYNATVFLPSETKHARLSAAPGKENICVLYSKEQLNYDQLVDYINQQKISIAEAVKNKYGKDLIPIKQVQFSDDNISFEAPADDNKLVCFFIELEHH